MIKSSVFVNCFLWSSLNSGKNYCQKQNHQTFKCFALQLAHNTEMTPFHLWLCKRLVVLFGVGVTIVRIRDFNCHKEVHWYESLLRITPTNYPRRDFPVTLLIGWSSAKFPAPFCSNISRHVMRIQDQLILINKSTNNSLQKEMKTLLIKKLSSNVINVLVLMTSTESKR